MRLEGRRGARVQVPGPGVWVTIGAIFHLGTHTSLSRRAVKCGTDDVPSLRVLGAMRPAGLEPGGEAGNCRAHAKAVEERVSYEEGGPGAVLRAPKEEGRRGEAEKGRGSKVGGKWSRSAGGGRFWKPSESVSRRKGPPGPDTSKGQR